jgi:hypothetical protein
MTSSHLVPTSSPGDLVPSSLPLQGGRGQTPRPAPRPDLVPKAPAKGSWTRVEPDPLENPLGFVMPWEWRDGVRPPDWTDEDEEARYGPVAKPPPEHTWKLLNLVTLGEREGAPEPPAVGGLFYPGRRHVLSGEAEAGKTWLLLAIAVDEIKDGHGVVWVDDDNMGPAALLERLRSLELDDEQIRASFAYLRPAERLNQRARGYIQQLLAQLDCRLVVFDAFNASLTLQGFDPNVTKDVEQFFRQVADLFCDEGAAVVFPDHVTKNREARGKYAFGAERKQTGVDVHLGLATIEAFGRGKTGKAKLTVHKDRPGFLERPSPGLFVLASDPESERCRWQIEREHAISEEGTFRPTNLMEKVSRYLETAGEPRSRNQIEQDVKGKGAYVRRAIDVLLEEEFAVEYREGQARLVKLQGVFRESAEWDAARKGEVSL